MVARQKFIINEEFRAVDRKPSGMPRHLQAEVGRILRRPEMPVPRGTHPG